MCCWISHWSLWDRHLINFHWISEILGSYQLRLVRFLSIDSNGAILAPLGSNSWQMPHWIDRQNPGTTWLKRQPFWWSGFGQSVVLGLNRNRNMISLCMDDNRIGLRGRASFAKLLSNPRSKLRSLTMRLLLVLDRLFDQEHQAFVVGTGHKWWDDHGGLVSNVEACLQHFKH